MATRDYSDSEDDLESSGPTNDISHDVAESAPPQDGESSSKPTSSNLRIKLRAARLPSHERSSLSPPPPLTLKFGLPPSAPHTSRPSKAERAAYSSSEDDEAGPSVPSVKPSSKAKKPRLSRAKKRPAEATAALEPPVGQAAGRKSYDWLIPSFAGASHAGPSGRDMQEPAKKIPRLSETNDLEEQPMVIQSSPAQEKESKRSHKKKRDSDVVGPGKAWRKGIKKGVMRPTRDTGIETPMGSTPGNSRPGSVEGTPEEEESRPIVIPVEHVSVADGPFVLADPKEMTVFAKPIVAPKMILSQFPKVTPYFLPNNGGDSGPFPRKEKTRSWKNSEREFVGIGGGTLKFKSWVRGPPGDLTNVLKAEKDVQDIKAKANKELADSKPKASKEKEKDGTEAKPKATKEKDETKVKAPKDDKPKQHRTIAIAPRPRADSGSDATPPVQVNPSPSNPAHFDPVPTTETSAGPAALSPVLPAERELPTIPAPAAQERHVWPSVLEPAPQGGPAPVVTSEGTIFHFGDPSSAHPAEPEHSIPMPDVTQPGWTSDGTGLSRKNDGAKHVPASHEKGKPPPQPRSSPRDKYAPLYTNKLPINAFPDGTVEVDNPEVASKFPRRSKLAQEIRQEDGQAE